MSASSSARHSGVDSPLASAGPLRRINDFLMDGTDGESSPARGSPVPVRLAEPMWRGGQGSGLHFIAACMKLQVALERFVALGSGGGFEEACASNPLVGALVLQLMQTAGLPPNASTGLLAERLEAANLACMYPLVACYLGDRDRDYRQKGVPVAHEAYDHMCAGGPRIDRARSLPP